MSGSVEVGLALRNRTRRAAGPSGVLAIDKPIGPTSHDIVAGVRRRLGTRAVGHAGTLDPMASGVLVVLLGEGTKLCSLVSADAKRYRATVAFGTSTDTLDAQGSVTDQSALAPGWLDSEQLAAALELERQRIAQEPPAFSAIKVAGQRAHRLARGGASVALPPRPVEVFELQLLTTSATEAVIELTVSKGYYVRSLARDLGRHLGVPAHLAALRRTASGHFTLDDCQPWPLADPVTWLSLEDTARRYLPHGILGHSGVTRARHGQTLREEDFAQLPPAEAEVCAWVDEEGTLVALGRRAADGRLLVTRGIVNRPRNGES